MSILIKGMAMPKNCIECPFSKTNDDLESDDYRFRYCDFPFIGEFVTDYEKSRHPACPLIELPPHGRLIDADALMLIIQEYLEEYTDLDEDGMHNLKWCAMKETEMAINDAPTIIEAEPDCATCPVKGKACKVFYRDKGDNSVCRELREAEGEE